MNIEGADMEMNLGLSERVAKLRDRVSEIIRNDIMPLEAEYHAEVNLLHTNQIFICCGNNLLIGPL